MSFFISAPETLNFDNPEQWPHRIRYFERYRLSSKLPEDEKNQVNILKYLLGDKKDDILSSFQLNNEQSSNYNIVKTRFDEYFSVRKNIIYKQAVFNKRIQMPNEPVDEFILLLYYLVEHCRFGALK